MKIMVIGSFARSLINFRGELLKTMVRHGHKVVACAPSITDYIRNTLYAWGVQCQNITLSRTGMNPFTDIKTLLQLISIFKKEKPDKILAYTIKPVIYSSLAARVVGIKDVYSMITGLGFLFGNRKSILKKYLSSLVIQLYKFALKENQRIFFQNPDDLYEFQKRKLIKHNDRTKIINGSGVNLQYYSPAPLPEKPSFLLIARLIADKGIREFAEAAKTVKTEYPRAKFRLVGWLDSNPSAVTHEEIDRWQQEGIIDYLGKLEDVRPAITSSRVYVLPSYREGTPRTVLEAMSMGRPIITTDAPGCRETVQNGVNGFLIPTRDSQALAQAMLRFIAEPELARKMGKESRRIAVEKYDVHKVNEVIMACMGLFMNVEQ